MAGAGYRTFLAAEVLTAAQVNTYLMQQSIPRFATTALRDAAMDATKSSGMSCYIDSGDASEGLYQYNGTAWRLPWNLPWGYVASSISPVATSQTVSTTAVTKITGTDTESCTLLATRRYRVTCIVTFTKTTAGNFVSLTPTTSASAAIASAWSNNMPLGSRELVVYDTIFTGVSYTGALQLVVQCGAAGVDISNNATRARMFVEDIGPAGAPV